MPDAAWKVFEREIAARFGGKRRGAHTSGDNGTGRSDIVKPGYSIECKLLSKIGLQDILNAVGQAERNRENDGDIALAVIKRKGDRYQDCVVVMRLESFVDLFVNQEAGREG